MADLVVTDDLEQLADELAAIVEAFNDATSLEDYCDDAWGQHNANLSMMDFADNWQRRRENLVKKLEELQKEVARTAETFATFDRDLADTLEGE